MALRVPPDAEAANVPDREADPAAAAPADLSDRAGLMERTLSSDRDEVLPTLAKPEPDPRPEPWEGKPLGW
ncbi:hypothetical protein WJX72_005814 [[Myrmecia] bisecta]|uniref:Uncharacterized protein n=1 Tax=[Myrmecia] bisecta TaxID=41462 RepID=A0AAW1PYH5_9CHLO